METMSFSALFMLIVFSGLAVFVLVWVAVFLLRYFGVNLKPQPTPAETKSKKVIAKTEYFSEHDGWHVVFNLGFGACYGILANLSEGQAVSGIEFEASILSEPNETCGFYELAVE